MPTLVDTVFAELRTVGCVATNSYLHFQCDFIKAIEAAAANDHVLQLYISKLLPIAQTPNFSLSGQLTNDFMQILGEASFYFLCKNKDMQLDPVPRANGIKTPDFKLVINNNVMHFEVKTLSIVDGKNGITKDLEDSLEAHAEIEKQLSMGRKVASGISVSQPYGEKPYAKGPMTAVIETLINKFIQNFKPGQFDYPNTFAVINMSCIHPFRTEPVVLRPAYCDDYMFSKAITGDLWMLAFGKLGMVIHGTPEFEGKPCVEGLLKTEGILAGDEYRNIKGIFTVIYPWQHPPVIWGLFRSEDYIDWNDNNHELLSTIFNLVGDTWNDDLDSNGWRLQGQ